MTTMISGSTRRRGDELEAERAWKVWRKGETPNDSFIGGTEWVLVTAALWYEARSLGAALLGSCPMDCDACGVAG